MLHWAKDMADMEETLCGSLVYEVFADGDDVTSEDQEKFRLEPDACEDCKEGLEVE